MGTNWGTSEYKRHQQTHLQTHLDKWSSNIKPDKVSWMPPESMNQDLLKIFEKYRLGAAKTIKTAGANARLAKNKVKKTVAKTKIEAKKFTSKGKRR